MRSLARYAATNALTRTMLSELLSRSDFDHILRSETLDGAWLALRKTTYGEWTQGDPPSDSAGVEKVLREVTASRFKRAIRSLRGAPRDVATILLSRWDIDNLEFALRIWHGRDNTLQKYLTYPTFADDVRVYDIVESETLEEIALILSHTSYFEPVRASLRAYREKKAIYVVEMALERDYYARLLSAVRDLGGTDASQAQKVIGAEIDMINLSWLARMVDYYGIKAAEFHEYVIPGPSEVSRRLADPGLSDQDIEDIRGDLQGGRYAKEGEGFSQLEGVALMEGLVREMAVDAAHRSLAGYPFSIGCVFAFYLLKRLEFMNLQTVFVAKSIGPAAGDVGARLYGLR
jgi:V/A-type H+-transporting ATPase subunit C